MTTKLWAYEDFAVGQSIELGTKHVVAEEIIEFASSSILSDASRRGSRQGEHPRRAGGLRMAHLLHVHAPALRWPAPPLTSQGAPGIDYVRWKKPFLPATR